MKTSRLFLLLPLLPMAAAATLSAADAPPATPAPTTTAAKPAASPPAAKSVAQTKAANAPPKSTPSLASSSPSPAKPAATAKPGIASSSPAAPAKALAAPAKPAAPATASTVTAEAPTPDPKAAATAKPAPARATPAPAVAATDTSAQPALSKADEQYFTTKVLPVLKQRCYDCHSHEAGKIKAGLAVDSREGLLKGGDSGPAVVPGNLDKSLLVTAIRYHEEDLEMPPKKKLADPDITLLEEWIKRGAPDPRQPVAGQAQFEEIWKKAKQHWAFKPIQHPAPPAVKDKSWVKTPVDAFILQKLEAQGMKPSPPADRLTLIRRVTYDLIGLPPTYAEVTAFVNDKSPQAYEKVVERLLASPHYGERWGRYWLDVARYADTTGDPLLGGRDNRYPFAWTYRDYVVRAFNDDKPYDRFIREQIAADKLPLGDDKHPLAALGFITVGKRFSNNMDDRIDDRIDVVTRGLMGLTVNCGRCHDHKFDPISQRDYYSLHGVFMSTEEPEEGPVIEPARDPSAIAEFEAKLKVEQDGLAEFEALTWNQTLSAAWQRVGEYLLAIRDVNLKKTGTTATVVFRQTGLSAGIGGAWRTYLNGLKGKSPVFGPWLAFAALEENDFATHASGLAAKFHENKDAAAPLHPLIAKLFDGEPPKDLKEVANRYGKLFAEVDKAYQDMRNDAVNSSGRQVAEVPALDADHESLRELLYGPDAVAPIAKLNFVGEAGMRADRDRAKFLNKISELKGNHPGAPARAMVLVDKPKPQDSYIYVRGDKQRRGPIAPRQFLSLLATPDSKPFSHGSGRLDLADAIVDKSNPLTPRIMVNRIWLNHFGQGLSNTPSDFGLRGDNPTHPELLDYLAASFMDNGWSIKKLHRLIVLSSAYQQRSDDNPAYAAKDPGNALLWKMNFRRLDFEAMRDTLLALSGALDPAVGGRPVDIATDATHRTLYASVDRLNLPGIFTTFDFALPDLSSPRRNETTVPTQALFLMNSPFVIEQAKKLETRLEILNSTGEQRLRALYQLIYQRQPSPADIKDGLAFLKLSESRREAEIVASPAWKYGMGAYDSKAHRLYPNLNTRFSTDRWTLTETLPDKRSANVALTAKGGVTGLKQAAIRRWTAPIAGTFAIEAHARIETPTNPNNPNAAPGIRLRILQSSGKSPATELGTWELRTSDIATNIETVAVEAGETIDFVAEPLTPTQQKFTWAPIIKRADMTTPEDSERKHQWTAETEFSGPPPPPLKGMTALEKYTQVLLLTNELLYVR